MNVSTNTSGELDKTVCGLARWDELPDLDLYLDQVVTFVNKQVDMFASSEVFYPGTQENDNKKNFNALNKNNGKKNGKGEIESEPGKDNKDKDEVAWLTPAMVNNYVKLKILPPPVKKRYNRLHLAQLIVLTLLKQVFSITDVQRGFLQTDNATEYAAHYDMFCEEIELMLQSFNEQLRGEDVVLPTFKVDDGDVTLRLAVMALCYKLLVENLLAAKS